jgi:hypothetical protein
MSVTDFGDPHQVIPRLTCAAAPTTPTPQQSEGSVVQYNWNRPPDRVLLLRGQNTALVGGVWWFGNKQGAWQEV